VIDHGALQDTTVRGSVSPGALGLATRIIGGTLGLDDAIRRTVEHFLTERRVEIVTVVLTSFTPEDRTGWVQLGGRAWMWESTRTGSSRTLLPAAGAGPEAALTMPWLSQLARVDVVAIPDCGKLPHEAAQDRADLARAGVRSLVTSAFSSQGDMFGSMSLVGDETGDWPAQVIQDFRLLAAAITSRLTLEQARRALAEAIEAGAEAQAAYQLFFGAVGHELRTPLAAIMGYTEVLLDDAGQAPDGPVVAALLRDGPVILRASEQLIAVVDDLLGAGRAMGSGDRQEVTVADAVADVMHWHRSPAETAGVVVTADIGPDLTVFGHASAVRQVLANLVGNAITHHRAEGGSVRISAERLLGESGQPMVRIAVRDDGPGLGPDQLVHAFDPFVRFAPRATKGTGLGLSISRTLAERDGGAVRGVSTPGTGSSFWLELPAQATAAAPGPAT
jgi:signal transduction histidine kinase